MGTINNIRKYILENELEIKVYKDKVNVVNYKSIGHFDNNKVVIYYDDGLLIIKGNNLSVKKLMSDEVLIVGVIKGIELG